MPFENRLQDLANSLEAGVGFVLLRAVLFLCLAGALFGLYAASQFRGLREPEAMECAQLARNLALGRGYTTRCIRPSDLDFMARATEERTALSRWPELRIPPLYPAVLAAGFKLSRVSLAPVDGVSLYAPERRVMVPLGIMLVLATGILVWHIAGTCFDSRAGAIAMLMFLLTDMVLSDSISGTPRPLAMLLCAGAAYAALRAMQRLREEDPWHVWMGRLAISAVLCGLAFLTSYAAIALLPALAVFAAVRAPRRGGALAAGFVLVFALVVAPWVVRNVRVCDRPFGSAPQAALNGTALFKGHAFDRGTGGDVAGLLVNRALKLKLRGGLVRLPESLPAAGLIIALFVAALFSRWEQDDLNAFRWCVVLAAVLLAGSGVLWGQGGADGTRLLLPLMAAIGSAFLIVILEKAEFMDASWPTMLTTAAVIVTALPAAVRLMGPGAAPPYPPYYPPLAAYVSGLLEPGELLCSDIPWATAWYGNRTSVLLPQSVEQLMKLHRGGHPISGLYLTTQTRLEPVRRGADGVAQEAWLAMMNGQVPLESPFSHALSLPPGSRDQVFLTDRQRWKPRPPSARAPAEDSVKVEATAE